MIFCVLYLFMMVVCNPEFESNCLIIHTFYSDQLVLLGCGAPQNWGHRVWGQISGRGCTHSYVKPSHVSGPQTHRQNLRLSVQALFLPIFHRLFTTNLLFLLLRHNTHVSLANSHQITCKCCSLGIIWLATQHLGAKWRQPFSHCQALTSW